MPSLPLHVQGGDSGELVAAAYRGLVAHPPGYPLWIWIEHFWLHALSIGTVFWRASLLSAFFSLSALAFLGIPLRKNLPALLLCLPVLTISRAFFEAAVLPDVFSFHALLVAAIGSLFLFGRRKSSYVAFGIPFLFFLSLAHQLTGIFLFPAVACTFWLLQGSLSQIRAFLLGSFLGLGCAIFLYTSLLFLHPADPFSWGELTGPASLWAHFSRSDYGSFQLAAMGTGSGLAALLQFSRTSLLQISPLLLISLWLLRRKRLGDPRLLAWGACCGLSILFFLFLNVNPTGAGSEVLLRFHLMPVLLLVFLFAYLAKSSKASAKSLWAACAFLLPVTGAFLFWLAKDGQKLRQDSIFEDYALNLLEQAQGRLPALVITDGDSAFFCLRYAQLVLGRSPEIIVLSPSLLFHPWYFHKLKDRWPLFELPEAARIWATRSLDFEIDLARPNRNRFTILAAPVYRPGSGWRLTYLALGRTLAEGEGTAFDSSSEKKLQLRTTYENREPNIQPYSKKTLFAQYSHFYLARGLARFRAEDKEGAMADWEQALERVPFAVPALVNLCSLSKEAHIRCSPASLEKTKQEAAGFFY